LDGKLYDCPEIFGGTEHTDVRDFFRTSVLSGEGEVLVKGRELVIFSAELLVVVGSDSGNVTLELDKDYPFVHCPVLEVTFLEALFSFAETLIADDGGWQGYCLVQRIEPVRFSRSGTQVKLTLRSSSVSDASIDRIYISQADPAGEPFDSAGDLTQVTSAPLVIPTNTAVPIPAVNYRFDETKPLLVAVDFSAAPAPASAIRCTKTVPPEQAMGYYKLGAEAATTNRAGFTKYPGLYLIESIEVF
jgi:hypothetical protein